MRRMRNVRNDILTYSSMQSKFKQIDVHFETAYSGFHFIYIYNFQIIQNILHYRLSLLEAYIHFTFKI